MVWKIDNPQGNESQKVRFDLVPYIAGGGLDIGCGPAKVFDNFVGVDNCIDTKLFGVQIRPDVAVPDATRLPIFASRTMACVFSSHLLEHIVDYKAALAEWWRLVAEGGTLILYLPHADLYPNIGQPGANPDHKHDFRPGDIVAAMREVAEDWDLEVCETRDQLQEYSFLLVFRRLAEGSERRESWAAAKPEKTAAIVRPGGYGDALWASSIAKQLHADGYAVDVWTNAAGAEVLAGNPHIRRSVVMPPNTLSDEDALLLYLWQSRKYTRWINLIGVVETALLPHPNDIAYQHPWPVRHARMNRNYQEEIHAVAQVPAVFDQRFYPTAAEAEWARGAREAFAGPLVVLAPTGSSIVKTWPHVQRFMELASRGGVHVAVVGDLHQTFDPPARAHIFGRDLPIRAAMALAQVADVVIGTESAIVNACASHPVPKIVTLSHSSNENLTKHWTNTIACEPVNVPCHPCHRLHHDFSFCSKSAETGFAACQSAVSAEWMWGMVQTILDRASGDIEPAAVAAPEREAA